MSVEWYTPDWIIERARLTLGSIDLDPCTTEEVNARIGATNYFTIEDDGLKFPWIGNIWLNPPYAKGEIEKFVSKFLQEWHDENIESALILTNNSTETVWFQSLIEVAPMIGLFNGRVAFLREGGAYKKPMQGQVIFYYGKKTDDFLRSFKDVARILISARWIDA